MDRLPAFVSEKLGDLIEVRDQLKSWAQSAMNRAEDDRHRLGSINLDLQSRRGTGMPMVGTGYDPGPEQAETQRLIGELTSKIDASVAEFNRRVEYARSADNTLNHCRDFLTRLPAETILERVTVPMTNGDAKKLLDLVRRDLAEAMGKLARLRTLPSPLSEVETRIREWVSRKAASQRLILRTPRKQPLEAHFDVASALGPTGAVRVDPLTLACLLNPEQVIDKLLTEAKRHPFANEGIGDEEFDAEVAALSSKIDEVGRSEEAVVAKLLQDAPTSVVRRSDAQPDHILGCRIVSKSGRSMRAAA